MNKTTAYKIFLIVVALFLSDTAHSETIEEEYEIKYLRASDFVELPKNIQHSLEARGCVIPQVYDESHPHNVIRGQFFKKGQKDWAVLCSKKGTSAILIFKSGSTKSIAEIESSEDKKWIQSYGDDQYGFSRQIIIADKKQILQYYENAREFGEEPAIVPIQHDGIDDFFVNKASVVHYYYQGKWLRLPGSD